MNAVQLCLTSQANSKEKQTNKQVMEIVFPSLCPWVRRQGAGQDITATQEHREIQFWTLEPLYI